MKPPYSAWGISTIPFWTNRPCEPIYITRNFYVLGSSNPWSNAVLMLEPFSTSVFKVHLNIITTVDCTVICPARNSRPSLLHNVHALYSTRLYLGSVGRVSVSRLAPPIFTGLVNRLVSCYTLLSWCRLPWPQSGCYTNQHLSGVWWAWIWAP